MNAAPNVSAGGAARIRSRRIVITAVVLGAMWALDVLVLRTGLLTPLLGRPAWTPLYAVPRVVLRPEALIFVAWSALVVWLVVRTCDVERCSSRYFMLAIGWASVMGSFALFLVRQDPNAVGALFDHYRNEEFIHDARSIVDPAGFLQSYVDLMPQLSTHGRHFPPGHALLLHGLIRIFGTGAIVAGIASLVGVGIGCVLAYRALSIVCDEARARQATWLVVTAPALLDFGSASMDAVYFAIAALALWLGLRALRAGATRTSALWAGGALFAATFFSFSTLMVGLVLAVYACFQARTVGRTVLLQLLCMAIAWSTVAGLLWLSTGFSIFECASEAVREARELMTKALRSENTDRARLFYGNAAAFAIMSGVGTIAALTAALGSRMTWKAVWSSTVLATLAVMCALYYLETERIWMFALPWIAAIATLRSAWDDGSLRAILAVNCAQALVMEAALFTLW